MELQPIQDKIYDIRGYRVMLDFDLAEIYGTETSQLKRQVRRNIERFEGDDFMFEVTRDELSRCQFGILNKGRGSNIKYMPFAFQLVFTPYRKDERMRNEFYNINRKIHVI